ncbi:ArsB/NhaD family transporter [Salirhabdus salicampi]|uniref:ArsB/NhaD family transporter n=1 Tax=Salirhabdus salicampi TaxID=476102 RepID=UPI0020C30B4A|nr:ArsB/NhaD family transporter [Salirhabdus salicampi]MCP8616985.1 ArsB/NhaD family transporter [Salirhabdus salicampi]
MEAVLSITIFIVSYMLIILEKVDRALIALAGGILMLCTGIFSWNDAFYTFIDWHTIALLFSMMVLVSITQKTGFFEYIALLLAQRIKGEPVKLLILVSCLTAIGSALLANVTTVLLFVPVIMHLTRILSLPNFPYLVAIIFSSNIGGTATLIGDPPNIMIGQAVEHFTFVSFLVHLGPVVFIIFLFMIMFLLFFFRSSLKADPLNHEKIKQLNPNDYLKKSPLLYKSLSILLLTIIGFLLQPLLHVDLTTIAVCGALLLLLVTDQDTDAEVVFREVEWLTLFFFIGLFILVGGLQKSGVIDEIAKGIIWITEGDLPKTAIMILWISGIFSGIVDNIPFVAATIPVIYEFQEYGMLNLDPLWWSLALGACLGGNGTLLGASGNVVVAGIAASKGEPISFMKYMKYGFPIVIFSLVISMVYVFFRYLLPFIQNPL